MAHKKSRSRQQSKKHRKSQKGGTATACAYTGNNGGAAANIHNTNPQASLDLDGKFMAYGGPVPLGSTIVGGGSCRNEGVGTSSPKNETFKEYITSLDAKLSAVTGGGNCGSDSVPKPNSAPNSKQSGAGYTSDPSEFVGGLPVYKGYDDNSPPAIIGGKLVFGTPDQPVCGSGAVGGGRKNKRRSKHKSRKNSKGKQNNKSRKNQRGGADFNTFKQSKPAEYGSAFSGQQGVFTDDMSQRTFEGKQPNWAVTDV